MLRKHEKFVKRWMLILCAVILVAALCISVETFMVTLVVMLGGVGLVAIAYYVYDYVTETKMDLKTAYKYYREIRRRLFGMGYNVNSIFQDPENFVRRLNHTLITMAGSENMLTSIDIATAIMYLIVDVDDGEDFVFDVFLCVMDKLMAPRRYKVSSDNHIFTIEGLGEAMKKADFEEYINDVGMQNFMKTLKERHDIDPSWNNPYLWFFYANACM